MKIIIIGKMPFPNGFGSSVFFGNLAAGLADAGCLVKLFVVWPSEPPERIKNPDVSGKIGDAEFCYTYGHTVRRNRFHLPQPLFLGLMWFIGAWRLALRLGKEKKNGKIDVIIAASSMRFLLPMLKIYARLNRAALISYNGEYPDIIRNRWYKLPWFLLTQRIFALMADGMIVPTAALERCFRKYARRDCRFCRIPILLKTGDFPPYDPAAVPGRFITYCGDMSGDKDGVETLTAVFCRVAAEFPDLRLKLIGSSTRNVMDRLKRCCAESGFSDRIVFTGALPHREVLAELLNSTVLMLTRPANRQAEGGFPSKLGEYLFTGNPALVSAVGEIPDVLTDRENVFFACPGDVGDFAQKLRDILLNPELAREVGRRGREFAMNNFACSVQCRKIMRFCGETAEKYRKND